MRSHQLTRGTTKIFWSSSCTIGWVKVFSSGIDLPESLEHIRRLLALYSSGLGQINIFGFFHRTKYPRKRCSSDSITSFYASISAHLDYWIGAMNRSVPRGSARNKSTKGPQAVLIDFWFHVGKKLFEWRRAAAYKADIDLHYARSKSVIDVESWESEADLHIKYRASAALFRTT